MISSLSVVTVLSGGNWVVFGNSAVDREFTTWSWPSDVHDSDWRPYASFGMRMGSSDHTLHWRTPDYADCVVMYPVYFTHDARLAMYFFATTYSKLQFDILPLSHALDRCMPCMWHTDIELEAAG